MSTIHDVARNAKVSIAAVSLVMNDPNTARVGPKKREIILKVARELNYAASGVAKALIHGQTRIVGLLVPMRDPIFFNHFIAQVLAGIQDTLVRRQYHLMIYSHRTQTGRVTPEEIQQSRFADGMIVLNTRMCTAENQRDTIADLQKAGIPFVMANAYSGNEPIGYVGMDDFQGGYLAGQTLASRGHKRIAMISGARSSPMSASLLRGFKTALKEANVPFYSQLHIYSEYSRETIVESVARWLDSRQRPTAIFAGDDQFVPEIYAAIQARGLTIPTDVAVLGRGNMSLGTAVVPRLTTIEIPSFQLGQKAAELLLNILHDRKRPAERIILPCGLVQRQSI